MRETNSNQIRITHKVSSVFKNRLGELFKREAIIDLVVEAYPGTNRGSIIPSDYCYNMINKGDTSFRFHLFESLGRGTYKYLGPKYQYSGPVFWKNEQVGAWSGGIIDLWKDPRLINQEEINH